MDLWLHNDSDVVLSVKLNDRDTEHVTYRSTYPSDMSLEDRRLAAEAFRKMADTLEQQ
jgi:hypothetical protein